jgi:hypothetical protein
MSEQLLDFSRLDRAGFGLQEGRMFDVPGHPLRHTFLSPIAALQGADSLQVSLRESQLLCRTPADMPLARPPQVKPMTAAITIIRAVVKGTERMLLKDAVAPGSANPIAAAARACQFRGLALVFHLALIQ